MTEKMTPETELRFFATAPRPCSYLAGRSAISVFADPEAHLSVALYRQLAEYGFRRSGNDLYVPACPGCSECVPVRIPVAEFTRSRNQNRAWRANADLSWERVEATAAQILPLFPLYREYLMARHTGGGMDDPTEDDYVRFLTSSWCESFFLVGRLGRKPVVVAATDDLGNALSAVYTFFDPSLGGRSLGTLAVLRQIELAREAGYAWLYLGYWIKGSEKMHYKRRFRPLHGYRHGRWMPL